jgi:hypothetical protein
MNTLRSISMILGIGCLVVGFVAALSGGGTVAEGEALGRTLVIAGAIIIAGVVVGASIVASSDKR